MSDENLKVVDLFGNERYLKSGKKGRPPFEWTEENSNKVSMLLALGWTNERIAGCILDPRTGKPISIPTLKRYFRSELQVRDVARDQLNAHRVMLAMQAAEAGNVGAMRLLDQLIDKNDLMRAEDRLKDCGKAVENTKPEKVGKKQLNAQAADEAEGRLEDILRNEALASRPN